MGMLSGRSMGFDRSVGWSFPSLAPVRVKLMLLLLCVCPMGVCVSVCVCVRVYLRVLFDI